MSRHGATSDAVQRGRVTSQPSLHVVTHYTTATGTPVYDREEHERKVERALKNRYRPTFQIVHRWDYSAKVRKAPPLATLI